MLKKPKLIRITTVPLSLRNLLSGQMLFMKNNGFDVIMISADSKERTEIMANEQCEHIIVPMMRKITLISDLKCLWQLIKIFRKEKPDIVHSHTPKAGLLGMIAAKICRVPVRIHTLAGLPLMTATGLKRNILQLTERVTYIAATNVWPNSFSLKKYLLNNKLINPKKLYVIQKGSSNGIILNKYKSEAIDVKDIEALKVKFGLDKKFYNLLFVGRIVKDKGIIELLDAFERVQEMYKNVRLILVGDFEQHLNPIPQQYIDKINNNPQIIFTKWVNNVIPFYHFANLIVFPSHREGFPNALLQAGAFQIPVVCSNIMGNVDLIKETTGQCFKVGNANDLFEKIVFALTNNDEIMRRSQNLYTVVVTQYDNRIIMQSILDKYNDLLN